MLRRTNRLALTLFVGADRAHKSQVRTPNSPPNLKKRLLDQHNLYFSAVEIDSALKRFAQARPPWWCPRCQEFAMCFAKEVRAADMKKHLERFAKAQRAGGGGDSSLDESVRTASMQMPVNFSQFNSFSAIAANSYMAAPPGSPHIPRGPYPIICIEGLDGCGKTTIVNKLKEKMGATVIRTPDPRFDDIRPKFDAQTEEIKRLFYCAANYFGAEQICMASNKTPVVVDRWWGSTSAMALANKFKCLANLPLSDDRVYKWPIDMLEFDVGLLLTCDEEIRVNRIKKRNDENAEEARLAANANMREIVEEVYSLSKMYHKIDVYNYRYAVNSIFDHLAKERKENPLVQSMLFPKKFAYYTEEQCKELTPY